MEIGHQPERLRVWERVVPNRLKRDSVEGDYSRIEERNYDILCFITVNVSQYWWRHYATRVLY